jgi:putative membrane protein
MRWFYLAVIVLFAAATLVFALQNFEIATVSFLGFKIRAPLALLTIVVYVLGAATGGSLLALLRRSYQGSRQSIMHGS